MSLEIKTILLVFGITLLLVILTRKAIIKVTKERGTQTKPVQPRQPAQVHKLTQDQFNKTWKNLSYLLLLAAAGSLYMVFTSVKNGLQTGLFIFWIDAGFSFCAAVAAVFIWKKRTKTSAMIYFVLTIIPIMMFLSIKGYKINALVHLFPLVLLYFVLKPVWNNMEPEI